MTAPTEEDDEWGELVDADFPRVDLVGKGANGVPRFLIAKQDGESAGLLEPGFVRDLIAKADPAPASDGEQVTVSGSPAAIAKLMSRGALSLATPAPEPVAKAKYSAEDKRKMLAAGHAIKNDAGEPAYPIGDKDDLGKAIHAVGRGGADHDRIRAYVIRRAKALGASGEIPDNWNSDGSLKGDSVSKEADGAVAKAAGGNPDLDEGQDGLDPTVVLAAPEEEAPGDPAEPGSPAWEAIDAATASKWLTILSRTQVALSTLAEREMLEAASADPDDCENAWDLEDACCAIDYAISVVAPYAVAEQCEADVSGEEMAGIAKAMETDTTGPLTVIEALTAVRKAGRVLSASNEAAIRSAAASLQQVLSSLPSAPIATDDVAKEAAMAADTTTTAPAATPPASTEAPAAPEAVAKSGAEADKALIAAATLSPSEVREEVAKLPPLPVAKADGEDGKVAQMMPVYDADGNLCGVVKPEDVTPLQGAKKTAPAEESDAPMADDGTDDLTPQPAADAGTPAEDVAKAADPAPPAPAGSETSPASTGDEGMREVLKSIVREALDERAPAQGVAKQADVDAELAKILKRLETVENTPAAPKVLTNGQVPPPGSMRGQDRPNGQLPQVDVAKAAQMRAQFRAADPAEQNRLAGEMQAQAIDQLNALHGRR